jgi:hypothetical protein
MKNYKIIQNKQILKDFINWLPELKDNEKFYLSLFARRKYDPTNVIKSDKSQVKRFVTTKERMFDKIKQLEVELGCYKLNDQEVPQEALALYINPNPRDMKKATFQMIKKSVELIEKDYNFNIHAEALSCIQRSKGSTYFLDFDIDDREINLNKLYDKIDPKYLEIVDTRGGIHILVKVREIPKSIKFHKIIKDLYNVDQIGDQLLPVPGCVQGGFIPKFIK